MGAGSTSLTSAPVRLPPVVAPETSEQEEMRLLRTWIKDAAPNRSAIGLRCVQQSRLVDVDQRVVRCDQIPLPVAVPDFTCDSDDMVFAPDVLHD